MSEYLRVKTFGGLNKGVSADQVAPDELVQCDNMWGKPDFDSSGFLGMLSKFPVASNWKTTMPSSGRSRGMFQFATSYATVIGSNFLMVNVISTDYSVFKQFVLDIDNNTWYTLATTALPMSHTDYTFYLGRVYLTNGLPYKWNGDLTNWPTTLPSLKNKGGTWTNIATGSPVLTWNATTTVTADKNISALISKGDYIRRSSVSAYADEVLTIAGNGLSLTLSAASSDTGASGAGTAQKAPDFPYSCFFIQYWKGRLWIAGYFSVYWSVPYDPEDHGSTALGAGNTVVADGTNYLNAISAMETMEDMMFIWTDQEYYVYRYSTNLDSPLGTSPVAKFNHGCPACKTIKNIGDAFIYFTGSDVRMTNGNSDQSIATAQMIKEFENGTKQSSVFNYYSATATDNTMPWAVYDYINRTYTLTFPVTAGTGTVYVYDLTTGKWIGKRTGYNAGDGVIVQCNAFTGGVMTGVNVPVLVTATSTSTNQLKQYSRTDMDYSNAANLFTGPIDFGMPDKKKKIHWIEFILHPKIGCSATLKLNYWDYSETKATPTSGGTDEQTYALAYAGSDTEYRIRKRFLIEREYFQFGWTLMETVGGSEGWGIIEWVICWDPIDSV